MLQCRNDGRLISIFLQPEIESDSYLYTSGLVTSDDILFASTLDGKLVALDSSNGEVLWNLHEEPVVKSPYDSSKVCAYNLYDSWLLKC